MEAALRKSMAGAVDQQKLFTKFKYMSSESLQKKVIDNIPTPTAGVEGNAICGSKNWVAVSIDISIFLMSTFLFSSQSKLEVVW